MFSAPCPGGFDTRPFVRGLQGRSVSMRTPTKTREALSKVLPLRWSFGSKDRQKPAATPTSGELVEYLESGRRPRCTKDPIATLMAGPAGEKEAPEPRRKPSMSSPSSSSLSCLGRSDGEPGSGRAPEGQYRLSADGSGTLRRGSKQRDDGTLTRRSSKKSGKQEQSASGDAHSHRSSGSAAPPGSDSTLKRGKGPSGPPPPEESRGKRGEEPKGHDGLLSFLKPGFLKKDSQKKQREGEAGRQGESTKRSSSRLSLSNGPLNGAPEGKANGGPRGAGSRGGQELANGRVARGDITRSQSSSSIPSRPDLTLRRSASLHRNGLSAPPPRSLTADKPSYGTLQRTRYSTTSLGRKRAVPESSF